MELEKNSKFKIYLVIIIFCMIIMLSAYVVITKIVTHQTIMDYDSINIQTNNKNPILEGSNEYIELSLSNYNVSKLYNLINNIEIEKKLHLMKEKDFDWSLTSSVIVRSIGEFFLMYEDGKKYIDASIFDSKYKEIFGEFKIGLNKTSTECDSVSFDISTSKYLLNETCSNDGVEMKTFLKNITYNKVTQEVSINKYYVFVIPTIKNDFYTYYEGKDLFTNKDLKQKIVEDIRESDISNYIHNMNVISYLFKKGDNGNYYLSSVK